MRYEYFVKCVIVGDPGVGKSCLAGSICNEEHMVEHFPTIGIDFKTLQHNRKNGDAVKLHIWDAAGEKSFRSIVETYCACVGAAIVVFDITNKDSFQAIDGWIETILRVRGEKEGGSVLPILIIGNKSDLSNRRVIKKEEAKQFASERGGMYMEVSARGGINVDDLRDMIYAVTIDKNRNAPIVESNVSSMRKDGYVRMVGSPKTSKVKIISWLKKLFFKFLGFSCF